MIKIIGIGKLKKGPLNDLVTDYLNKISHYHKIQMIEVKDEPLDDRPLKTILDLEGQRALKQINDDEYVILLDLNGQMMDSLTFAKQIASRLDRYAKITFVIGGSMGLGECLYQRANFKLKLSELTFLHTMTRYILAEQLYRAFKINNHETYHK